MGKSSEQERLYSEQLSLESSLVKTESKRDWTAC